MTGAIPNRRLPVIITLIVGLMKTFAGLAPVLDDPDDESGDVEGHGEDRQGQEDDAGGDEDLLEHPVGARLRRDVERTAQLREVGHVIEDDRLENCFSSNLPLPKPSLGNEVALAAAAKEPRMQLCVIS